MDRDNGPHATINIVGPPADNSRVVQVFEQIKKLKINMVANFLDLGELLAEAKRDAHPEQMGYELFGEWLEASGLDISERTAYYLIKIVENSKRLEIPRQQLLEAKMSSLKEIFTLDAQAHPSTIKSLVLSAPNMKLDQVREAVHKAKNLGEGERLTWRNFRVTDAQAEIIDQAVERAKMECGSTINGATGELEDISDGRALELIAADFIAGPDQRMVEIEAIPDEDEASTD